MTKDDFAKFTKIMKALQNVFTPEKAVSKERAEIYFEFLKDLSINEIEKACCQVLKTKKIPTFPTIGEIRERVESSIEDRAIEAWHVANRNLNIYDSVCFNDHVIHSVIENEFGGWEKFCNLTWENESWDRRRFIQAYMIYARRKEHPKYLPGFHERENQFHGWKYEGEIRYIGEPKEVKKLEGKK